MCANNFCFCMPLRIGVIILGYLQLVGGIFMVFLVCQELVKIEKILDSNALQNVAADMTPRVQNVTENITLHVQNATADTTLHSQNITADITPYLPNVTANITPYVSDVTADITPILENVTVAADTVKTWLESLFMLQRCSWVLIALSSSFAIVGGHMEDPSLLRYYFFILSTIYILNGLLFIAIILVFETWINLKNREYVIASSVHLVTTIYFLLLIRCAYRNMKKRNRAARNKRQGV